MCHFRIRTDVDTCVATTTSHRVLFWVGACNNTDHLHQVCALICQGMCSCSSWCVHLCQGLRWFASASVWGDWRMTVCVCVPTSRGSILKTEISGSGNRLSTNFRCMQAVADIVCVSCEQLLNSSCGCMCGHISCFVDQSPTLC